ncbi:hypothetical protein B0A48_13919 [Cryoendolithus antarcticus]|uniref:Uncharacterized protein n=1 Tax=Cryoendolithus antarcticus TaxID=1507870 RepID=A0A1V8SMM1_9PEZI|nr:hypothetical protein B0A48_13919 [Cryoendolithus antarcticus]
MSTTINDPFVGFDYDFDIDQNFDFDAYYATEPQIQEASTSINGHTHQLGPQGSEENSILQTAALPGPHASSGFKDQNIDPQLLSMEHQAASAQDRLPAETDVDQTAITNDHTPLPAAEESSVSVEVYPLSAGETYTDHSGFTNEIIDAFNIPSPIFPIDHQLNIGSAQPIPSNMQNTQYAPTAPMYGGQGASEMPPSRPSSSHMEMGIFQTDTDLLDLSDPNDGDHLLSHQGIASTQMAPSEFQYRQREPYNYGSQIQHDTLHFGTVPYGLPHQSGASNMATRETISAQSAFLAGPSAKRPATAMSSYELPQSATRVKRDCTDCGKVFYNSQDISGLRCTRCQTKFIKNTAGHTIYEYDPEMEADDAKALLHPQMPPLNHPNDDVDVQRWLSADYMRALCEAVSTPYTENDPQPRAQQTKMNKKPFDSDQYRANLVNARLRILFETAVSYHAGGPTYYDIGGDNNGYGEDKNPTFSQRLNHIIQLLRRNKDIAMDVIEGRGVTALVKNPDKYERRKRDNKKSNDTKASLQEKGKRLEALEQRTASRSMVPGPVVQSVEGAPVGNQVSPHSHEGMDFSEAVSDDLKQYYEGQPEWQVGEVGLGAAEPEARQAPDGYRAAGQAGWQPGDPY